MTSCERHKFQFPPFMFWPILVFSGVNGLLSCFPERRTYLNAGRLFLLMDHGGVCGYADGQGGSIMCVCVCALVLATY